MAVPFPSELAEIPIPNLSQSRLQRYKPIPVELWIVPPVLSCKTFLKNTGQIALWYAYAVIFNRQDNAISFLDSKKMQHWLVCTVFYCIANKLV